MEQQTKNDFPCLEQARQGNTVTFQNKYLYSRYNPTKEILRDIENRTFLPGTLVLCFSPCLCYGVKELLDKLPENCIALGIEVDGKLHEFTKTFANEAALASTGGSASCEASASESVSANAGGSAFVEASASRARFCFVPRQDILKLPQLLNTRDARLSDGTSLLPKGTLRRCVAINFSAGVSFHADFYRAVDFACTNAIAQFWKNRVTLTKLGRRFSRNLIRNLSESSQKIVQFKSLLQTVVKPIIVFGAGESLEQTALELNETAMRENFYVIAVDAAFSALAQHGIIADAVVCEEAQIAIADAFIGFERAANKTNSQNTTQLPVTATSDHEITLFAGISSWTGLKNVVASTKNARLAYFATKYDDTLFFEQLEQDEILPPVMQPLGSVGLTATEIALRLRANEDIPIYVSGLDFSYSIGATHARGTTAHIKMLASANRFSSIGNYGAAFGFGAESAAGIGGKNVITTKALSGYAEEFRGFFVGQKNLFDARITGLPLGLEQRLPVEYTAEGSVCNANGLSDSKTVQIADNNANRLSDSNTNGVVGCNSGILSDNRTIIADDNKLNILSDSYTRGIADSDINILSDKNTSIYSANLSNIQAENNTVSLSDRNTTEKLHKWCETELSALSELRSILAGEKKMPESERNKKITELLSCREYLYLHFPDGYALSLNTAFLKRVRAEIDFFEKDFNLRNKFGNDKTH